MTHKRSSNQFEQLNRLTIFKATSAGLAMLQVAVLAMFFGTSAAVKIFFAATFIQATVMKLSQTNQLAELFIPTFHRLEKAVSRDAGMEAFAVIMSWGFLIMATFVCLISCFAWPLVQMVVPGFDYETKVTVYRVLLLVMPTLFPQVLAGVLRGFTLAEGEYISSEIAVILGRLANTLLVVFLYKNGISALVIGFWAGQLVVFFAMLSIAGRLGFRYRPKLKSDHFSIRTFTRTFPAMLSSTGATMLYLISLNAAASLLPLGMYAVFGYVQRIMSRATGLLIGPVSVNFHTVFSRSLAAEDNQGKKLARQALQLFVNRAVMPIILIGVSGFAVLRYALSVERVLDSELSFFIVLLFIQLLTAFLIAPGNLARKMSISLGYETEVFIVATIIRLLSCAIALLLTYFLGKIGLIITLGFVPFLINAGFFTPIYRHRHEYLFFYDNKSLLKIGTLFLGTGFGLALNYLLAPHIYIPNFISASASGAFSVLLVLIIWEVNGLSNFHRRVLPKKF